jgi:hypothetical protein
MVSLYNNSFLKYCKEKGVKQIGFENDNLFRKSVNEDGIIEHMHTLSKFHKEVRGYNNYIGYRLEDKRGRTVEQYKIYIKKIKRQYESIKKKSELSSFEKLLLEYGDEYLKRAENCIKVIYENGYLELIKRSMDRNEICIGDTSFNNLRIRNQIEVNDLSKCVYDLVEIDGADFLLRLIKKGLDLDYENLVREFCKIEGLDSRSENFIKAVVSYPSEFMKCCIKYNKKNEIKDKDKYEAKLKKIVEEASISLI